MIITVERPSNVTIDGFRENDIIDSFTTIMGMLKTRRKNQYLNSHSELLDHITY
jgi:uncharacterized protein YjbK